MCMLNIQPAHTFRKQRCQNHCDTKQIVCTKIACQPIRTIQLNNLTFSTRKKRKKGHICTFVCEVKCWPVLRSRVNWEGVCTRCLPNCVETVRINYSLTFWRNLCSSIEWPIKCNDTIQLTYFLNNYSFNFHLQEIDDEWLKMII